jgi:hydroxyacylglutathione hydrolase
MRISTIRSEGIAALSYFLTSEGQGIVIDPRRDASIYHELSMIEDVKIVYIFETHRNEDYVTGSLELQSMTPEAEIGHSRATDFQYGEHSLTDGETFRVGKMGITCLQTPGHTEDSMCFVVSDRNIGSDPIVVFTGDTLFVNEVGRTDLVDKNRHAQMSQKLFVSLHSKLLLLGDGVIVHPGHGAGSVCGGAIGDREFTSIGFERANNIWLQMSEEDFVDSKTKQELTLAPYFKHCELLNTIGPPILSASIAPQELDSTSFADLLSDSKHFALDTRSPREFLKQHIPGSICTSLSNMGLIAGWILKSNQRFSLILGDRGDFGKAWSYLVRVGLDNIVGILDGGIMSWISSGRSIESIKSISIDALQTQASTGQLKIIDVREPHEFGLEHIEGSISLPLTELVFKIPSFKITTPAATLCPSGFRSTTAASLLKRAGYEDVCVAWSGLNAWREKGYPLASSLHL